MSNAERVVIARMVLGGFVRMLGVAILVGTLAPAAPAIYNAFEWGLSFFYWDDHLLHISASISMLVVGLAMTIRSRQIARKLVRIELCRCPKCTYRLEGKPVDRCPECGLYLGPDFMDPPVESTDDPA